MTAGWCARTTRAAVFAAVCVLLAALGHVLMSGSDVPAWALAAGAAVTGAAGWCLAGRERGLPLIVSVVVLAQTVLHEAFSYAQSASGGPGALPLSGGDPMDMGSMGSMGSMGGTGSMGMGDMGSADMSGMGSMGSSHTGMSRTGMGGMGGMGHTGHLNPLHHAMDGGSTALGMLAAHLLAAVLCGLWLAYGEKGAFRILRAAAGRLVAPLGLLLALPVPPDRPRLRPRRRRSDRAPRLLLLVHAITSRGPPVGPAVV
ncbi:hypothetical protein JK359_14145 [Streptomyces actinomycinicus]|uniref:PE-PGRS family protein n=1 Tax=Streptomyces actinomycinicus TaxID=1695166 RepID=A0A937JP54_9ACTN|nr:hypothetical protein [Streptomyces actinomycinicus]MBL1083112.1 hypothetical protein [Streptomyces actinomycinicus]